MSCLFCPSEDFETLPVLDLVEAPLCSEHSAFAQITWDSNLNYWAVDALFKLSESAPSDSKHLRIRELLFYASIFYVERDSLWLNLAHGTVFCGAASSQGGKWFSPAPGYHMYFDNLGSLTPKMAEITSEAATVSCRFCDLVGLDLFGSYKRFDLGRYVCHECFLKDHITLILLESKDFFHDYLTELVLSKPLATAILDALERWPMEIHSEDLQTLNMAAGLKSPQEYVKHSMVMSSWVPDDFLTA
jgi:hypothetical protein